MRPRRNWAFIDKCYIAKFYERDGCVNLAALYDCRHYDIANLYKRMREANKLERYKLFWDLIQGWKTHKEE